VSGGEVVAWDASTGRLARRGGTDAHTAGVTALVPSADGSRLVSADQSGGIVVWDVTTLRPVASDSSEPVRALAIRPDGRTLAVGGEDGRVRLLDASSLDLLGELVGHDRRVASVAFSQDGELLASGGDDRTIRLWDVDRRAEVASLAGHTDQVLGLAFTAAGRLASAGEDATVRLWDLERRMALGDPITTGSTEFVVGLATDAEGEVLVSAQGDDVVAWDIDEASWVRQGCTLANRPFTEQERIQFLEGDEPATVCPPA
jgi:WD40 repeat protein